MDKIILYSIIPLFSTILSVFLMRKFIYWSKKEENIREFVVKQNKKLTIFELVLVISLSILDILLNFLIFFHNDEFMFLPATLSNLFVLFFILMFFGCLNIKIIVHNDALLYISFFRKKYKIKFLEIGRVEKVFINGNKTLRLYFQNKKVIVSQLYDNLELLEKRLKQSHIKIEEKW